MNILKRKFFERPTLEVARELLGCVLVRKIGRQEIRAVITETEAYAGEDDLASHASRGRTPRTELMYGEAGRAYVYMVYGMHHCLNVVTERKDYPAAVLIRAVSIEGMDYGRTNGPGKLCKALGIDRELNGHDMTKGEKLWMEKGDEKIRKEDIIAGKRIGVEYAKHSRDYTWRFTLRDYAGKKKKGSV